MGLKKNNPGCQCCTDCVYGTDAYGRADDIGDVGSLWQDGVGDWAINGSEQLTASTSNAFIMYDVEQPNSLPNIDAEIEIYGMVAGDEFRVLLDVLDDDNYLFVQATLGSPNGQLAIGQCLAGVVTILSKIRCDLPITTWHRIGAEWGNNVSSVYTSILARASGSIGLPGQHTTAIGADAIWYEVTATNNFAGLGTGAIGSQVKFDNWRIARTDDDCEVLRPTCTMMNEDMQYDYTADPSNVGPTWEEVSGSWTLTSFGGSALFETSSSNAILLCNVAMPTEDASILFGFGPVAGGDEVKNYFNWQDASNHSYLQTNFDGITTWTVELVDVVAGTPTTLAGPTTRSVGTYGVCWSDDRFILNSVDLTGTPEEVFDVAFVVPAARRRFGFGTGTVTASTVFVPSQILLTHSDDHPDCDDCELPPTPECAGCTVGAVPASIPIQVDGHPNDTVEFYIPCGWAGSIDECVPITTLEAGVNYWTYTLYSAPVDPEAAVYEGTMPGGDCTATAVLAQTQNNISGCTLPATVTVNP